MIIKRTFYIFVFILNTLVITAMLVGKSTAWITPEQATLPTFFGLFFPYLAILNSIFIIFWLFRLKWQVAIIPILAMALTWSELQSTFSFFKTSVKKTENTEIKLMTYNVAYFGFFEKDSEIIDYIMQSGADVVALQEFGYFQKSDKYFSLAKLENVLKAYPYRSFHTSSVNRGRTQGLAVFSKYPIVNEHLASFDTPFSKYMYTDIKVGNDTLRIFNLHLESNGLTKKDKEALFGMAENFETSMLESLAGTLSLKIGEAAKIRVGQSQEISAKIAESPYSTIVVGDFNDTPVSYTYKTIGKDLTDTFVGSGAGMGITFHENLLRVRIDYMLHSKDIISDNHKIEHINYSDHYPVQASFWLKK